MLAVAAAAVSRGLEEQGEAPIRQERQVAAVVVAAFRVQVEPAGPHPSLL